MKNRKAFLLALLVWIGISGTAVARVVEGQAVVVGGEHAEKSAIALARKDAIEDAIRRFELKGPTRVISNSFLNTHGQLFESTFLTTDSPVTNFDIVKEKHLGGLYRVWVDFGRSNNAARRLSCSDYKTGFVREVEIELSDLTEDTKKGAFDVRQSLNYFREALSERIKNDDKMSLVSEGRSHGSDPYSRSALIHTAPSSMHTIRVSVSNLGTSISSDFDTFFSNIEKSLSIPAYRFTLDIPGEFSTTKDIQISTQNPALMQEKNQTKVMISEWISQIWSTEISPTITCLPMRSTVARKGNQATIALGADHGMQVGETLLLMSPYEIKVASSRMQNRSGQTMSLYQVASVGKRKALINPLDMNESLKADRQTVTIMKF
jgi:hypothetical protein